jgi:hypothetical protein
MAARSSALVGSLIGDLVCAGTGDEDVDCLPHKAVALLTDAKVDFSGDVSSFAGDTSTLGGAISFSGVDLEPSVLGLTVFVGGVGNGRANRDCRGAGDDDGDAILLD